jgi:glycosyltransferase involved in cell wall biosynthesis
MHSRRLRVLYLQPAPLYGGAERQAALHASLLPGFGVDVIPVAGPGRAVVDWLTERGVTTIVHSPNFPGGWPKQRGLGRLTLPWRYLDCGVRAHAQFVRLADEHDPDVIVASLPFAWITGSLVALRRSVPIVWRAGGERINVVQRACLRLLTTALVPDALLCNAEAVRRTFEPYIPAPVSVIANGVDADHFRPGAGDRNRYRPPGARVVVGYASRLTRAKRPQEFIEAAARLRDRHPDARFLLAGGGSIRPELERLAAERHADNLDFLGFVSDMQSFYAACDVIALPSGAEGCPNFLLEAMAMGKPVVASDVAPVLELVHPGHDALVFPLGDVDELTETLSWALEDAALRAELSSRARQRALSFSATASAAKLAALLKRLHAANVARRIREGTRTRSPSLPGSRPALPAAPAHTQPRRILDPDPPDMG